MDTKIILKAEAILEEMVRSLKAERSSLYSDIHLSKLANNYNLSFKIRTYDVVTTIKLTFDFELIGVFTWVPEGKGVKNIALESFVSRTTGTSIQLPAGQVLGVKL